MNQKIIIASIVTSGVVFFIGAVSYFMINQQALSPSPANSIEPNVNDGMYRGIYGRIESNLVESDTTQSTLGEIIGNQIKDIQITEYYGGWLSADEAKKELLVKLDDKEIRVSSSPVWNLDMPVQFVGTIEYKDGSKGIIAIAQHRVGFQDSSGESWYFGWEERFLSPSNIPSSKLRPCELFMGNSFDIFHDKTDENVLGRCDDKSFVELDYEYGKDKNFVYFRPMPNANKMTIVLEGADPKTFELIERCPGLAADKNHVYESGRIAIDKNPTKLKGVYIEGSPETYCY